MLRELQRDFRSAVLGSSDGALVSLVTAPRGSVAARIDVYRNTVQASLAETLAAAFPVVERIIGAAFFAQLAQRFIAAHPPRVAQLSAYGADFPAFIAENGDHGLAYLADVARLEWSCGESYFAADAAPLDPATLLGSGADIAAATLRLHPASKLVRSAFPLMTIWRVNQPDVIEVPAVDFTQAETVLTTRRGQRVTTRALTIGDGTFIESIAAGMNFGEAAATALANDGAFDLQAALAEHLRWGTFRAADGV
jgi:hypothetical protein